MTIFARHGFKPVYIDNEFELRCAAVALARYAVGDIGYRGLGDPVHEWITEGRRARNEARRKKGSKEVSYSSCGDLAHWMLMCLGCRDESVVNRSDDGGVRDWRMSVNISRLRYSRWFVPFGSPTEGPSLGDILYVANTSTDGHVAVLTDLVSSDQWISSDYGQPYAKRRVCQIRDTAQGRIVRGKQLVGWVDISKVERVNPAWVPESVVGLKKYDNPY